MEHEDADGGITTVDDGFGGRQGTGHGISPVSCGRLGPCATEPDLGVDVAHHRGMHFVELRDGCPRSPRITGRSARLRQRGEAPAEHPAGVASAEHGGRLPECRESDAEPALCEGRPAAQEHPDAAERIVDPTERRVVEGVEHRIDLGKAAIEEAADERPDERPIRVVREPVRYIGDELLCERQVLAEL